MIRSYHDGALHGHSGISETVRRVSRKCRFPGIKEKVTLFIKRCVSCQKNKHATHAKYGGIQTWDPPEQEWREITMDFITKLPPSRTSIEEPFDGIFVVVDKLTKYTMLIGFRETWNAEQLGYVLLDRVIPEHGVPESIVSDRDKLFTSRYWQTLMAKIGVRQKLSTAYHPTTDGQTERMNQTVEQYLRHYINHAQDNWAELLPMAQLALNSRMSQPTGVSPFKAVFGHEPRLRGKKRDHPGAEKALWKSTQLMEAQKVIHDVVKEKQRRYH